LASKTASDTSGYRTPHIVERAYDIPEETQHGQAKQADTERADSKGDRTTHAAETLILRTAFAASVPVSRQRHASAVPVRSATLRAGLGTQK
jgi:hypothetical protein